MLFRSGRFEHGRVILDAEEDFDEFVDQLLMFEDPVFKGIDIIRVKAVDGKAPNIDNVLKENFNNRNNKQTDIQYACLLSHLNTINMFNNSKYNRALIMEDDMTLEYKPYWKKTINEQINEASPDLEILQLCAIINDEKKLANEYNKNDGTIYSAGAYVINKYGSNKINSWKINNKYSLNDNYAHVADDYIFGTVTTYIYKYPMFTYKNSNDSNIDINTLDFQTKSKKIIDKIVKI